MTSIGDIIHQLRTSKKLSVTELADLSGVTRISIYDWEKKKFNPTIDNLIALAKGLGIPAWKILKHYEKSLSAANLGDNDKLNNPGVSTKSPE